MSSEPRWSREQRVEPGWYVWAPDHSSKDRYLSRLVVTAEGEPLWLGIDHGSASRWLYGPVVFPALPDEGGVK